MRQASEVGERLVTAALSLAALLAPFFFLQWLVPFAGELVIGMDYPRISTPQQQELVFSLVHGSFPLFVPGFAGGQSAGALTSGQLYHPITYLAALLPGYWDGHALELNTLLRMASLGAVNLLLFRLLRRLCASGIVAFLLACATVFNLRMLNVFHGAAALEAFTGHLFTAVALAWCWIHPERRLPRVAVAAATYCTIASGHPQFAYFSLLGTLLAALLMPAFLQGARGLAAPEFGASLRYWARMAGLAALAGLLAAPYALQFQLDFMADNMRIGRSYDFSLRWGDTLAGALDNFFQPLHTATAGAFGGSALLLVAALAPAMALFGARPPRHVLLAWLAFLIAFLCSLGDLTPVHHLFWRFVPLFDSVRGPGRLTVVVPFLALVILVWVFRAQRPARGLAPLAALALLALVLTCAYRALPAEATRGVQNTTPAVFNAIDPSVERAYFGWSCAALIALAVLGQARERRKVAATAGAILLAACSMQTRLALRHGVWTEVEQPSKTLAEMRADKLERLAFAGDPGAGLYSTTIAKRLEHSCLDPFLARLYTKHVSASDNERAYALLDAGRPPDTLIVECGEPSSTDTPYSGSERVELVHASFNRVLFDVRAAAPAWLELTWPYSRHWHALVNGAAADVLPANGAYQAVRVPAGASTVEFRYVSRAAELGMLLACLGFVAGGVWLSHGALRGARRLAALGLIVTFASGAFAAWRASLYSGKHMGTRYVWTPPADARANLAFQRPTRMSPIYPSTWDESQALGRTPDPWGCGNAVDGVREAGRGIRTTVEADPHWIVDLAGAPLVAEVAVYGASLGQEPGARLAVELWDGESWMRVAESASVDGELERFVFEPRSAARVRLQANGTPALAADEVEIYGPEP